jgi:ankyrin repeat protein
MRPRTLAAALTLALLASPARAFPSPMERAVRSGDPARVAALLDAGSDLDGTYGPARLTPLKLAVRERRPAIAKLLLDRGADPNIRRNGTSALSLAAIGGDLDLVELLLARGAVPARRDELWARGPRRDEIVARLKAAAAKDAAAKAAAAAGTAPGASAPAGADAPSYKTGERPDDFAVVVGVPEYMDGPPAAYAGNDAEAMRRHLIALGWPARNVLLLTGRQAGRAGLEKYLEKWLPNNATENSRIVFYFAGCGAADPKTGEAYLLPWDGDPAQLEVTGYPLARLYRALNALKPRWALAVIDAGFSGAGPRTAAAPGVKVPVARLDAGEAALGDAAALLAVSAGDEDGVRADRRHGALTESLLEGLNGAAAGPHGEVTLRGLFARARAEVSADAKKAGRPQTPRLLTGGLGEGDLRLR